MTLNQRALGGAEPENPRSLHVGDAEATQKAELEEMMQTVAAETGEQSCSDGNPRRNP